MSFLCAALRAHRATPAWALLCAAAVQVGLLTRPPGSPLATAWPAAGVCLVWVVWAQRRRVLPFDAAVLVVVCAGVLAAAGYAPLAALAFGGVNLLHGLVGGAVLRRLRPTEPIATILDLRAAYAVCAASVAGGFASAVAGGIVAEVALGQGLLSGTVLIGGRNALCCFAVAAALMGVRHAFFSSFCQGPRGLGLIAGVLAGTVLCFAFTTPVAFTVLVLAVVAATYLSPDLTAQVTLLQGAVVVAATHAGRGPFATVDGDVPRAIVTMTFVAAMTGVGLTLSTSHRARRIALASAQRDRQRLRDFMDAAQVASAHVLASTHTRELIDYNQALVDILGDPGALTGADPVTWFAPHHHDRVRAEWSGMLAAGDTLDHPSWRGRLQLAEQFSGRHVDVTVGVVRSHGGAAQRVGHIKIQLIDITAQRRAEKALEYAAHHDSLTGLGNRVLFRESLGAALAEVAVAESAGESAGDGFALLYIDVDHFKAINDAHGHLVGDAVLVEIARRVVALTRRGDCSARIGGDEFVLVAPGLDLEAARALAHSLVGELAQPVETAAGRVAISASIGLAHSSTCRPDLESMMHAADTALYDAKAAGRGRYAVHGAAAVTERRDPLAVVPDWSQLTVHYQRINDIETGAPTAVEALIRWEHPDDGTLEPVAFLHRIDAAPARRDLARFVLARALADFDDADAAVAVDLHVNVSAYDLSDADFADHVLALLAGHRLPADRLVLELVESHALDVDATTSATLRRLHHAGVRFAVDDFGTGYNALGHLIAMPIDVIKLDRTFVASLADRAAQAPGAAVADGIKTMADRLGIELIAEGVETREQIEALRSLGYRRTQGFYSDRPRPWGQVRAELRGAVRAPVEERLPA